MTPDEIKSAIDALAERATRTPTAFNWTPAMEAIWPRDMRPTMSGLLAIWEAMHEAAVYEGADANGWIPHKPGDPMPCDGNMMVDVRFAYGGERYRVLARDYYGKDHECVESDWWLGRAGDMSIVAWRPAK